VSPAADCSRTGVPTERRTSRCRATFRTCPEAHGPMSGGMANPSDSSRCAVISRKPRLPRRRYGTRSITRGQSIVLIQDTVARPDAMRKTASNASGFGVL
jgi:hypothetical protein